MSEPTPPDDRTRGLAAFDRGDFMTAVEALTWCRKAGDFDPELECKLGWAQSQCNMHALAIATLDEVVRQAPDHADAHVYRGVALARAGRLSEAADALQAAIRLDPAHPHAGAWLQWVREQAARPATARVAPVPESAAFASDAGRSSYVPAPRATRSNAPVIATILGLAFLAMGALALLISAPLMFAGRRIMQLEREFPAPKVLSLSEFVEQRPKKGWYRITGAALNLSEATWLEMPGSRSLISDIHVPVRGVDEDIDQEPVRVLFTPEDPAIQATVRELARIQNEDGEDAVAEFTRRNIDRIWIERDVEGVVPAGFERTSDVRTKIEGAYEKELDPDYGVLDDRKLKPGTGNSLYRPAQFFLVVGLGFLLLALMTPFGYRFYTRRQQASHS